MTQQRINEEITTRIEEIEDDELRSFLREVIAYERKVLPQTQPRYKSQFQRYMSEHFKDKEADQ